MKKRYFCPQCDANEIGEDDRYCEDCQIELKKLKASAVLLNEQLPSDEQQLYSCDIKKLKTFKEVNEIINDINKIINNGI